MINHYLNTRYRMTNLFLISMVLFVSCVLSPRITYYGEHNQEGKYHGQGVFTYINGDKWEGEFKDGEPFNGNGTFIYLDSSKFVGEWENGEPLNGEVTNLYSNGQKRIIGGMKNGEYDGFFTSWYENGHKEKEGTYSEGKEEGLWKEYYDNGNMSVKSIMADGIYSNILMAWYPNDNIQTETTPDSLQTGWYENGKIYYKQIFDGLYTSWYENGQIKEQGNNHNWGLKIGIWTEWDEYGKKINEWNYIDGKRNGQGTLTLPDGGKYVGDFKDGKANGQGTNTWLNGEKYVGEYKDDKRNGKGVFNRVNGKIQSGTWVNDTFQKNWTIEAVDNFLRNKYPQFKGLNYSTPITSVPSQNNEVYLPPPPDNPSFIAVVDFTGNNVSEGDCRALTDRLRAELFNTKYFKVIEREMMEEIIEEQGFQQSGCSTDECMVEVGKLIGVEKIIGGSISQVGNVFSVSARIVNVETGEIETTGVYDHMGNIGELLTSGMKKVSYELVK